MVYVMSYTVYSYYLLTCQYMNKITYDIRNRETGTVIDSFGTLQEATLELAEYEAEDRKEKNYTEDFYEIVEAGNAPDAWESFNLRIE